MGMMKQLDDIFTETSAMENQDIPTEPTEDVEMVDEPISDVGLAKPTVCSPPPVSAYTKGGMRYQLVYEGVCVACAHCGQPLTDSESVERGIGPVCSKKGYLEEVVASDSTDAMMALAEYPELVDYLVAKYKEKGNRGLVNGLVRTASLNRRTPVHAACTDAVEALGYKRLASTLRESISAVEIYERTEDDKTYGLWIKKADFSWSFWNQLKALPGVYMTRYPKKATVVPKTHRLALAQILVQHYNGLYVKTPKGAHKISEEWFSKMSSSAPQSE